MALLCDISTVVASVARQGGTVSFSLSLLARQVLEWAELLSVRLVARCIPVRWFVLAVQLCRQGQVLGPVWSLHPLVVERLWVVALFASRLNRWLPVCCSPVPVPVAALVPPSGIRGTASTRPLFLRLL